MTPEWISPPGSPLPGVFSEVGAGTTFKVYLPAPRGSAAQRCPRPASAVRGSETVLVEDEDGVRALVRHILADSGYEVLVLS